MRFLRYLTLKYFEWFLASTYKRSPRLYLWYGTRPARRSNPEVLQHILGLVPESWLFAVFHACGKNYVQDGGLERYPGTGVHADAFLRDTAGRGDEPGPVKDGLDLLRREVDRTLNIEPERTDLAKLSCRSLAWHRRPPPGPLVAGRRVHLTGWGFRIGSLSRVECSLFANTDTKAPRSAECYVVECLRATSSFGLRSAASRFVTCRNDPRRSATGPSPVIRLNVTPPLSLRPGGERLDRLLYDLGRLLVRRTSFEGQWTTQVYIDLTPPNQRELPRNAHFMDLEVQRNDGDPSVHRD